MDAFALQVDNISKSFNDLKAVDNVSFNILKGEILGLLGPNGAGKTTAINLITGELKKDSGSVKILGMDSQKKEKLTDKIGICTQQLQLWPLLTCQEQLKMIGALRGMDGKVLKEKIDYFLEELGLKDKRKVLAKKLSGGMQRRLHIILSIIHEPEILIFDEPEAGLDPQSRVLVRDFIKSLKGSKSILLTTHNMDEAERLSDRVAIMDKGKILENDSPSKLRKKISPEDTLEVFFEKGKDLSKISLGEKYSVKTNEASVTISGENLIGNISFLLDNIGNQVGKPENFNFRQSSLEDVFIKLTGRSLRE